MKMQPIKATGIQHEN